MKVAIVDYGSGNLRSAENAFLRAARESNLAADIQVTADADVVAKADKVVLPGVGAFRDCRDGLHAVPGMAEAVIEAAMTRAVPFLGICVGMQLMAETGREHGDTAGFGWIKGEVSAIRPADATLKIPHMGWNALSAPVGEHPVLAGIAAGDHVYFVHSYAMRPMNDGDILGTVDYGGPVTAIIGRDNIIGTQFHPEKSQAAGLRLIANFLQWEA